MQFKVGEGKVPYETLQERRNYGFGNFECWERCKYMYHVAINSDYRSAFTLGTLGTLGPPTDQRICVTQGYQDMLADRMFDFMFMFVGIGTYYIQGVRI